MINLKLKQSALAAGVMAAGVVWADYSIVDIGTLGGNASEVSAINNNGVVLGTAKTSSGDFRPFLFDGTMHDIYQANASDVNVGTTDINDNGQIAAALRSTSALTGPYRAVILDNGVVTELGSVGGGSSLPYAINANGDVAGFSSLPDNVTPRAFLYTNGAMVDLGTLPGNTYAIAHAVNSSTDVVGISAGGNQAGRPFLYRNGAMYDLGSLGGSTATAYGINDSSQIVGYSRVTGDTMNRAFLYDNGAMADLGDLSGRAHCVAWDINNSGSIVGSCGANLGGADPHAFLYSDGVMQDLNDLLPANSGWTLLNAKRINDNGQIAGVGVINGERHAYMMSPGC